MTERSTLVKECLTTINDIELLLDNFFFFKENLVFFFVFFLLISFCYIYVTPRVLVNFLNVIFN